MKKPLIFLIVALILGAFVKCSDDNPAEQIPNSSFSVSVTPESTAYNGTVYVLIVSENLVANSIKLNGGVLSKDSFNIPGLVKDTILAFTATGLDNTAYNKNYTVKVAEPPVYILTRDDSLCHRFHHWQIDSSNCWNQLDTGVWDKIPFSEQELLTEYYYLPDGTIKFKIPGVGTGNGKWWWVKKDSIYTGGIVQYYFTDSTLVFSDRNGTIITTLKGYPFP